MPQLAKGGKWVFGWTTIGQDLDVLVPPAAYQEYGFQAHEEVVFLRGSRSSSGFIMGKRSKVLASIIKTRILAEGLMGEKMKVRLPSVLGFKAGDKLLVVRGSGLALSFLRFGRICEEALRHPEIEEFSP